MGGRISLDGLFNEVFTLWRKSNRYLQNKEAIDLTQDRHSREFTLRYIYPQPQDRLKMIKEPIAEGYRPILEKLNLFLFDLKKEIEDLK